MFPLQPGLIGVAEDERIDGWRHWGLNLRLNFPFFLLPLIKTSKPTAVSCLCTPRVPRTSLIFQGLETGPPGTADFWVLFVAG